MNTELHLRREYRKLLACVRKCIYIFQVVDVTVTRAGIRD